MSDIADVESAETGVVFDIVVDFPAVAAENAEAIRAFWKRESALKDDAMAGERLKQVVMHALAPDGEIAGVCTAMPTMMPMLGQPMYFWRTFVGAKWRSTQLVMTLLKRSCTLLEEHARANDYPCIGILLELENTRFKDKGRMAVWYNPRFFFIGRSQRGLDMRAYYFKGARLRSPK
jgi:hypothetical protein